MRFQEILKYSVLVVVMFGLAGSAQAQKDRHVTASLTNYEIHLIYGPFTDSGSSVSAPHGLSPFAALPLGSVPSASALSGLAPFAALPLGSVPFIAAPPGVKISPGHLVREVVSDAVDARLARNGYPVLSGHEIQELLNDRAYAEAQATTPVMNAYSFTGTFEDGSTKVSFVIDIRHDRVAGALYDRGKPTAVTGRFITPTRLVKQLNSGDWRGVDHGAGSPDGTVSYSTMSDTEMCSDADDSAWILTDDGLIPASPTAPVNCIKITIVDGGIYDVDGSINRELNGLISDPVVGVMDDPGIQLAHASSVDGGGGGSAGTWTILALLSLLALSTRRRRSRIAVRDEL